MLVSNAHHFQFSPTTGNIDSKDQRPNEYLPEYFDKTPWQLNRKPGKALIVPLPLEKEPADYKPQPERPRPAPRTAPKIEAPKPDSPLHSSFALSFNSPQNPRVVARTRASTTTTTNSRRGNALDLIPAINNQASSNRFRPSTSSQNSANSRTPPRFPAYSAPGRVNQPQAAPSTPSTTTTTTTPAPVILPEANLPPKPSDPKSNADYVYDYVYEDAPAGGQPSPSNNKPPALPALPSLDDATSPNRNTNAVSTLNTNLGALFGGAIGQPSAISSPQQPPQLPKLSASSGAQRPPARSQIPQPNGLNFFNSNNPFHSNPFASNPFSSSNTGSLIRQKRANEDEAEFSCHDKLVGIGYADVKSLCKSFYICLPLSKGKYKKYELFCDGSYGYNQLTAQCEPLEKFDCKRSPDFYLYNKQANMSGYLKNRFRIAKQLAEIKN